MEKYEYKVKTEEMRRLMSEGDYVSAADIADSIDWGRVKKTATLCAVGDIYKKVRRYNDALELFNMAYDHAPGDKDICYALCELYIKTGDIVQMMDTFNEFSSNAPTDPRKYILRYRIYEAQDVSLEERIEVLEELKKRSYRPKWAYTLAYLYHRMGLATRCVEECDELILWFGEGRYVTKALELKMLHAPLTVEQKAKYDNRYGEEDAASYTVPVEGSYTEPASQEEAAPVVAPQTTGRFGPTKEEAEALALGHTQVFHGIDQPEVEIQIPQVNVGEYNTINLQESLAEQIQAVMSDGEAAAQETGEDIQVDENGVPVTTRPFGSEPEEADVAEVEVMIGETAETPKPEETEEQTAAPDEKTPDTAPVEALAETEVFFGQTGEMQEILLTEDYEGVVYPEGKGPGREDVVMHKEQPREVIYGQIAQEARLAQPPEPIAEVLTQEADGQIGLVIPERQVIDKQITGQLSIVDVMAEWERMKQEQEERSRIALKREVAEHTGKMFTEFEASVRDGILDQIDREVHGHTGEIPAVDEYLADAQPSGVIDTIEPEDVLTSEDEVEELEEIEAGDTYEEPIDGETPEYADEYTGDEGEFTEEEVFEDMEDFPEESAETEAYDESEAETETEMTAETETEFEEIPDGSDIAETGDVIESEASETTAEAGNTVEILEAEILAALSEEESRQEPVSEPKEEEEPAEEKDTSEDESLEEKSSEEDTSEEDALEEDTSNDNSPKSTVRALSKEEYDLFGQFVQTKSARRQLVDVLDKVSMAAYTGNIVLTGDEGTDVLSLATNIMRELKQTDSNFSGSVARISAKSLNIKGMDETLEQFKNGALIVDHASELTAETAAALYKALQHDKFGIVIALVDTRKGIEKLFAQNPDLEGAFNARMNVVALSNDKLVEFAKQYAKEREFSISDMGVLELHTCIESRQTLSHAVNVMEVKEIVDRAIEKATSHRPRHFFDVLLGRRYDKEDMIILSQKDFENL